MSISDEIVFRWFIRDFKLHEDYYRDPKHCETLFEMLKHAIDRIERSERDEDETDKINPL